MGVFITRERWEEMVVDYPINVEVVITDTDGVKYNQGFFMETVNPKDFKDKMDRCQEMLITTLMSKGD